jgi:hypothetical protein
MLKFSAPVIRTVALAAALGSFSANAYAQADSTDTSMTNTGAASTDSQVSADKSVKSHGMMNVEKRISTLHDKLKITPDEESAWATVAQTMRDNESKIDELVQARHANPASMTAVDDLESYEKIVQAHADGLQNMIASFKTLYTNMSQDQQKNADMVFGSFEGHGPDSKHSKKHSS